MDGEPPGAASIRGWAAGQCGRGLCGCRRALLCAVRQPHPVAPNSPPEPCAPEPRLRVPQGGGAGDDRGPAGSRQRAADQHAVRLQAQPGAAGFRVERSIPVRSALPRGADGWLLLQAATFNSVSHRQTLLPSGAAASPQLLFTVQLTAAEAWRSGVSVQHVVKQCCRQALQPVFSCRLTGDD